MKNKTVDQVINDLNIQVKWVLIVGAVLLILMPIAVTQLDFLLDFTGTGPIGDTLGGTTAPVIGVVSALLIYFSFRAQINANRIIQKQIDNQKIEETSKKDFEHQMERYRHLKNYIDNFKITIKQMGFVKTDLSSQKNEYIGSEAISIFLGGKISPRNSSEMRAIISFFNLILNNIKPIKENLDSKFIFNLVEIQFYRNIWDLNEELILYQLKKPSGMHSENSLIIEKINQIHIEMIAYKEIWPD